MRQYETAFLIAPDLSEEETEKIISQMAVVVSQKKGKMIKEDRWGKRKLAYPIKRFEEAFYVFFHYEGDTSIPFELERRFKQTETILRFLTIKIEVEEKAPRKKKPVPKKEESPATLEGEPTEKGERKEEDRPAREKPEEE